jgi:hypothetical protein
MRRPLALTATRLTSAPCPSRSARCLRVATSHSRTVWSWLPVTSVLPSGVKAIPHTLEPWPRRISGALADGSSHSAMSPLQVPAASLFPSDENVTEVT